MSYYWGTGGKKTTILLGEISPFNCYYYYMTVILSKKSKLLGYQFSFGLAYLYIQLTLSIIEIRRLNSYTSSVDSIYIGPGM